MGGIVARMPFALKDMIRTKFDFAFRASDGRHGLMVLLALIVTYIAVVIAVVIIQQAQRRVTIQTAKQTRGRRVYGGQRHYMPLRVNHAGVRMDGQLSEVIPIIQQLHDAGKGLYAMKVLGCGELTGDIKKALTYVLGLGTVHALSIGTSSRAQLHESVRLMDELASQYPIELI